MDPRFISHNYHLIQPENFDSLDPHLLVLKKQPYIFRSPLIEAFPTEISGIYLLSGGRQIGKTTLLKQWMSYLLHRGIIPTAIAFLSGELIDDHHMLLHLLQQQLTEMPKDRLKFLILDEVSYINGWDKGIKFAADSGLLDQTIFMITGSDMTILEEARARFPGRRGKATVQEFHLYPLSFGEFVKLKRVNVEDNTELFRSFDEYLIHGGYMTAINDLAKEKKILEATLITYSDWIRGDILKKDKKETYLREILAGILKRYGSQITWNTLAKDLSIDHPSTVADYIFLLESMDALFVQSALLEDKLTGAPKKAKKIFFTDPFIYHAISYWLKPTLDPFVKQITTAIQNPEICSILVEACVVTHYRRYFPTYFIKGDGEVDVAYIKEGRFWPVEVKWTQQIQKSELKQFAKYSNGIILTKWRERRILEPFPTIPVPVALIEMENTLKQY
jgi:predicted AAA+ superfamily ATPase